MFSLSTNCIYCKRNVWTCSRFAPPTLCLFIYVNIAKSNRYTLQRFNCSLVQILLQHFANSKQTLAGKFEKIKPNRCCWLLQNSDQVCTWMRLKFQVLPPPKLLHGRRSSDHSEGKPRSREKLRQISKNLFKYSHFKVHSVPVSIINSSVPQLFTLTGTHDRVPPL